MRHPRGVLFTGCLALAFSCLAGGARAQGVSQEEHDRLKRELAELRAMLDQSLDEMDMQLLHLRDSMRSSRAGTNRVLLTGYAVTDLEAEDGASIFAVQFQPIMIWQLGDRLLFQAEPEFEIEDEFEIKLEFAHAAFHANDHLTLGAGKFLIPFGSFNPRLHPAWINKQPRKPMAFGGKGISPETGIGGYARGGFDLGHMSRASYSLYVVNEPELITEGDRAGALDWVDGGTERSVGGRAGLTFLGPGIDIGASFQTSDVADIRGIDVGLAREVRPLGGFVDLRFEGLISEATNTLFLPVEGEPGMKLFENRRVGGYGQLAYRPSLAASPFFQNLETSLRYDWLDLPDWEDGTLGNDADRYTAGIGYLLASSMQFKVAYERTEYLTGESESAWLFRTAFGF